jgi:hypothetical protein
VAQLHHSPDKGNNGTMSTLATSNATFNISTSSTGIDPEGWREFWRVNGTTWRDIAELNAAAINHFLETSTFWASS